MTESWNKGELAPVLLFVYNRADALQQTIAALQQNALVADTELYVFSDGAKNAEAVQKVTEVRSVIRQITGFKKVTIYESETNKGLAASIIAGVTQVITRHHGVIVLEDDLLTATNFLAYMNACLQFYQDKKSISSIAGYTPPIKANKAYTYDAFLFPRSCSHGWATWADRWMNVDWNVSDYKSFAQDAKRKRQFNRGGSDLSDMLKRQQEGKLNSWAIRFCYYHFLTGTVSVYPTISKVVNNGFNPNATNTSNYNRYRTPLDKTNQQSFLLPDEGVTDAILINRFQRFYSIPTRAVGKVKSMLHSLGIIQNKT